MKSFSGLKNSKLIRRLVFYRHKRWIRKAEIPINETLSLQRCHKISFSFSSKDRENRRRRRCGFQWPRKPNKRLKMNRRSRSQSLTANPWSLQFLEIKGKKRGELLRIQFSVENSEKRGKIFYCPPPRPLKTYKRQVIRPYSRHGYNFCNMIQR